MGLPYLSEYRRVSDATRQRLRLLVTRPPYPCAGVGELRIIAERERGERVEWIIAYPRYSHLWRNE